MPLTMQEYMERKRDELIRNYRELNRVALKGKTVLAGSSLMENFRVNELLMSRGNTKTVYNRGIGGMTVEEYDGVLDLVLDLEPSKLIINIGTNDLNLPGDTVNNLITRYRALLTKLKAALPVCEITVLAYYPCRKGEGAVMIPGRIPRTMEHINEANARTEALAGELGMGFRNLNSAIAGEDGYLDPVYAIDTVHFSQAGYVKILNLLEPLL